ncbi:MAG: 50S ribosomal protein L6 [Candidatus Paceibacterota bacterium]|jgi:large subunit ribosomal protein L6
MSRLGKKPIIVPQGVSVDVQDDFILFTGPKGNTKTKKLDGINVEITENGAVISPKNQLSQTLMNWGTMCSLVKNGIEGVEKGFSKTLIIEGVGFKASLEGENLVLKVGFSHPVSVPIPEGISLGVEKNTINISGIEKDLVGQMAANIRKIKKPEPYLGKGIRYSDEVIRRKAGKKAGAAGAK